MRIVCPNCSVHYEVDDAAIPKSGRDVQCSACNHAWFQNADGTTRPVAPQAQATPPEPEPAAPTPPRPARPPTSRRLDPVIAEILREEAEREARARRGETPDLIEGQTEMALQDPDETLPTAHASTEAPPEMPRSSDRLPDIDPPPERVTPPATETVPPPPAPAPPAQEDVSAPSADAADVPDEPKQVEPEPAPEKQDTPAPPPSNGATTTYAPRRELLPDIDEINSSLRAQGDSGHIFDTPEEIQAAENRARRGRGFRWGFSTVMLVLAAALLVYAYAPQIIGTAPEAAPAVQVVVVSVDSARLWLDQSLATASTLLTQLLGGPEG